MAARPAHPPGRATRHPPHPPPPEPPQHPAHVAAVLVAALCVAAAVTTPIADPDLWQHLLVGKAIWTTHAIPLVHQWTWPRFGEPEILPSWGFRFVLWPVWEAGGPWGLTAWRWLTTLAAFALAWRTARLRGAGPFVALAVVVWCALIYRQRSMVRPDTLVAILLAAEIGLLELRRRRGARVTLPLVLIAAVWVNVHLSYALGLLVLAIYAVADRPARPPHPAPPAGHPARRRMALDGAWVALLGAALVSFANPFGWRAAWEPFRFLIEDRGQPIFASIAELQAIDWSANLHHGLPVLMLLWPLLILASLSRRAFDPVEAALCALTTAMALTSQRFVGYYAIVAAPFVARGLTLARAPARGAAPRPWWSFARFAAACAVGVGFVCSRPDSRFGLGLAPEFDPVHACDFIERHGVAGRGFNYFDQGGYQAWRFWPDRSRLPFMDVHQSGSAGDRRLYVGAMKDADSWRRLDAARHFDYLILHRTQPDQETIHDSVEADSTWVLVFLDDAAALYLRRGTLPSAIDSFGFRRLAVGRVKTRALGLACMADTAIRSATVRELERVVAESPEHAAALSLLANLFVQNGDTAEAETRLREVIAAHPEFPSARLKLGWLELEAGRPVEALKEFRRVRTHETGDLDVAMGSAYRALGDRPAAVRSYRRALRRDPGNETARDSLLSLGAAVE